MALDATKINGPAGPLELLHVVPLSSEPPRPPLLFVHGSFCSARDYMFLLPYLARHGFPAYAVSLRGHGGSQAQGWFGRMVLTGFDSWAADVKAALDYVTAAHPESPPAVLGGHSLGGGLVQYMLSNGLVSSPSADPAEEPTEGYQGIKSQVSGLILLAAAPISGDGQQIMENWQRVEAPNGYPYFWSERCVLKTVEQVRAAFFSKDTDDATIRTWMAECKTAEESARAGLSILWSLGHADRVLPCLEGIKGSRGVRRKVLCVAGSVDKLVTPKMVEDNAVEYELATGDDNEACLKLVVEGAAHHLMMDAHWESCAQGIVNWLNGDEL
ncbi:alpha/beta-hydrolase [Thozetella sp. PMI_491]|nr:alpha/beta-hydrolase [Thozetella sp. PMI_491]